MNTTTATSAESAEITTVESLVAEARRRGFKLHGGFMPPRLIPMVQATIAEHNTRERGFTENSADYIEWKQTMDNLQQFLALLKTLPDRLPYESASKTSTSGTATAPTSLPSDDDEENDHADEDEDDDDEYENENDFDEEDDENDPDTLIEKVEKYLAENRPNGQSTGPQPNTTVRPPSTQASDPRLNPVCDPSPDASDASADASPKQNGEPQSREEYFAQILRESTSHSPIDDFPPERQQALYELILEHPYTRVVGMIAKPEPLGWNFQTSDTSLKRFKKRYQKKLAAAELANAHAEAQQTIQQTGANEQAYLDATRRLLKIRLYKNAADPEGCSDELELLMRLLDRQRRTDLAERRVRVAEHRATQQSK